MGKLIHQSQKLFDPIGNELTNWHDYYGAIHVLASFANFDIHHRFPFAYWNHGVSLKSDITIANKLTLGISRSSRLPIWLHRNEHAELFVKSRHIHVIGHAFAYAPDSVTRSSKSVLIMPGHTIHPDESLSADLFQRYVNEVSQVYPPNEDTYVCLNTNCLRNGYWITEFSRAGYAIISGSRIDDASSYNRMKVLFGHFDIVVSNVIGSHIAFAAASGCRVGLWGTPVIADPSLDAGSAKIGRTVDEWLEMSKAECPFLYTDPGREEQHVDWGRFIVGYHNKRSVDEISMCLQEACDYQVHRLNQRRGVRMLRKIVRSVFK